MTNRKMTQVQALQDIVGKKIVWAGYDDESDDFYLLLEDMSGISFLEFSEIANGPQFVETFLSQKLSLAESVMSLKQFHDSLKTEEKPAETVLEPAQEGAQDVGREVGSEASQCDVPVSGSEAGVEPTAGELPGNTPGASQDG